MSNISVKFQLSLKLGTHRQQSRLLPEATKSTVAGTDDKSATKSTVVNSVDFVADAVDFVTSVVYEAKVTRSTLTVLNSTLSPVCTRLKTVSQLLNYNPK